MKWLLYTFLLFGRDLGALHRQPWFYPRRLMLATSAGLVVSISLVAMRGNVNAPGVVLFRYLLMGMVVIAFMLAVWSGGNLLLREREQRTLELLMLSELGWSQLIVAKFLYTVTFVLLMLSAALPIIAVCYGLGGVNLPILGKAISVVLGMTLLGSAVGICISATARRHVQVRIWSGAIGAITFIVIPGAGAAVAAMLDSSNDQFLVLISPIRAIIAILAGNHPRALELHLLLIGAATLLLLLAARMLLPRSMVATRRPSFMSRLSEELLATSTMQSLTHKPHISGNPVSWMDLYSVFGGYRLSAVKLVLFSAILISVILTFCAMVNLSMGEAAIMVWRFLTLFYAAIILVGTISRSSTSFSREQRSGALDVLLTSDLTNRELLQGKAMGIVLAFSPYALALLGCLVAAFTFLDSAMTQYTLVLATVELLGVWFACCSVAFYLSIKFSHSNNIVGACILYSLIWAFIVLVFPINGAIANLLFAVIASIWHGYIGMLCWRYLDCHCRELLLHAVIRESNDNA